MASQAPKSLQQELEESETMAGLNLTLNNEISIGAEACGGPDDVQPHDVSTVSFDEMESLDTLDTNELGEEDMSNRSRKRRRQASGIQDRTIRSTVTIPKRSARNSSKVKVGGRGGSRSCAPIGDGKKLDTIMDMIKGMSVTTEEQFKALAENSDASFKALSDRMDTIGASIKDEVEKVVEQTLTKKLENFKKEVESNVMRLVDEKLDKAERVVNAAIETMGNSATQESLNELKDDVIKVALAEIQEIEDKRIQEEKRKRNAIVGGLSESKATKEDAKRSDDTARMQDLIVRAKQVDHIRIRTAVRLGKLKTDEENDSADGADRRSRLLKVILGSEDQRERFISELAELRRNNPKDPELSKLTVRMDRSKEDRKAYSELRKEREYREKRGESNLIIRGNKIWKEKHPPLTGNKNDDAPTSGQEPSGMDS